MVELRFALVVAAVAAFVLSNLALPAAGQIGERPYEMAGRKPEPPPLVDFEELTGWTVTAVNGAEGSFGRSREQQIWGDHVGKLTYKGTQDESAIEIRPPKPIPIPEPWDCCCMWIYGDNWGWTPAPNRPWVYALVEDAEGKRHHIDLGQVDYQYWSLAHRRVMLLGPFKDRSPEIARPARFVGFRVTQIKRDEPSAIYFDNLAFYQEVLKPLKFERRAPLPFPTRRDTILPSVGERCEYRAIKRGGTYVFESKGESAVIRYEYRPERGTLDDIRVVVQGGPSFAPLASGGPRFEVGGVTMRPEDEGVKRTLREIKFENGVLRALWRWEKAGVSADWSLSMRLKGRSVILDIRAPGGKASELDLGHAEGVLRPKAIHVPFLSSDGNGPKVLHVRGVFVSALYDWYVTDASTYRGPEQTEKSQRHYAGRLFYQGKTDGKRNPLRERIFLTVSPRFDEVLPNIPNPKSDMMHIAKRCLWRQMVSMSPDALKQYKFYGLDDLIPCHHEIIWRDGGESFTQRLESAPKNVGDERLKEYMAMLRGLGFLPGLYTNYRDFAPVNRGWDPDKVNRRGTARISMRGRQGPASSERLSRSMAACCSTRAALTVARRSARALCSICGRG